MREDSNESHSKVEKDIQRIYQRIFENNNLREQWISFKIISQFFGSVKCTKEDLRKSGLFDECQQRDSFKIKLKASCVKNYESLITYLLNNRIGVPFDLELSQAYPEILKDLEYLQSIDCITKFVRRQQGGNLLAVYLVNELNRQFLENSTSQIKPFLFNEIPEFLRFGLNSLTLIKRPTDLNLEYREYNKKSSFDERNFLFSNNHVLSNNPQLLKSFMFLYKSFDL